MFAFGVCEVSFFLRSPLRFAVKEEREIEIVAIKGEREWVYISFFLWELQLWVLKPEWASESDGANNIHESVWDLMIDGCSIHTCIQE